jgi:hypothetical protein
MSNVVLSQILKRVSGHGFGFLFLMGGTLVPSSSNSLLGFFGETNGNNSLHKETKLPS